MHADALHLIGIWQFMSVHMETHQPDAGYWIWMPYPDAGYQMPHEWK